MYKEGGIKTPKASVEKTQNDRKNTENKKILERAQQVSRFAERYFQDLWESGRESEQPFGDLFAIEDKLAELSGSKDAWEERKITPAMREAVATFLDALLAFIVKLKKEKVESEAVERFTAQVQQALFSGSPNLINLVGLDTQFNFAARTTRVPEAQGFVGPSMVGELAYELTYSSPEIADDLTEKFLTYSVAEQLDVLHVLETIGFDANANSSWAEDGLEKIKHIVGIIGAKSLFPLVQYKADITLQHVTQEEEEPTQSVIQFAGDRRNGRSMQTTSATKREHKRLVALFGNERLRRGDRYVTVSSDYSGVIDQSGQLQQVGQLAGGTLLSVEEFLHNPTVLPFGVEQAFTDEALLFQQLHQPEMREYVEQLLHLSFAELPVRNQLHLLRLLAEADAPLVERLQKAVTKSGINREAFLNSFFACAEDTHFGEVIIQFVEQVDAATANSILEKYVQALAPLADIEREIEIFFTKQQNKKVDTRSVVQEMAHRSNRLLVETMRLAQKGNVAAQQKLDGLTGEVLTFAAIFKTISKKDTIEWDEVQGVDIESKSGAELSATEKEAMQQVFIANRPTYTERQLKAVLDEFNKALRDKQSRFYLLKKGAALLSFVRFDELPNGNLYAGSFNVRTEARGSAIGSAFLHATLDREGEGRTIEAVVYEKNPMLEHYISDFGFKEAGVEDNYNGTGERYIKLLRP